MAAENESEQKKVMEFFFSQEQKDENTAQLKMGEEYTSHGSEMVPQPLFYRYILTQSGWKEYTEEAPQGYYKEGKNRFGAEPFYSTQDPVTYSIDAVTGLIFYHDGKRQK